MANDVEACRAAASVRVAAMEVRLDGEGGGAEAGAVDLQVLHQALDVIARLKPRVLIYVSCEPSTLARDLKILCARGYQFKKIQPVDLFLPPSIDRQEPVSRDA